MGIERQGGIVLIGDGPEIRDAIRYAALRVQALTIAPVVTSAVNQITTMDYTIPDDILNIATELQYPPEDKNHGPHWVGKFGRNNRPNSSKHNRRNK